LVWAWDAVVNPPLCELCASRDDQGNDDDAV
jgi:hypothetical protein